MPIGRRSVLGLGFAILIRAGRLKRTLLRVGVSGAKWTPPVKQRSPRKDFDQLTDEFGRLLGRLSPRLSEERRLGAAVQRLQEKLEDVKSSAQAA